MNRWLMLVVAFLAGSSVAVGQEDKDPLVGIVGEDKEPLDKGEMRLNVVLLRVARGDVARLLLGDNGENEQWEERLLKWKDEDKLEWVYDWQKDAHDTGTGEWEINARRKKTFLSQSEAAVIWDMVKRREVSREAKPDLSDFLDHLRERDTGHELDVKFEGRVGEAGRKLSVNLFFDPSQPMERNANNWPLEGMSIRAPKLLFRPWELMTSGWVKCNEVFLLGAQMDALNGENWRELRNGMLVDIKKAAPEEIPDRSDFVLMAFGRVTAKVAEEQEQGPKEEKLEMAVRNDPFAPAGKGGKERVLRWRLQSWTLAVEIAEFQAWVLGGQGANRDEAILTKWLEGQELLATGAMMLGSGARSSIVSECSWDDVSGFEPSSNALEYRPKPCEEELYAVRHGMEVDFETDGHGKFKANLRVERPSAVGRWVRWKTAMDREKGDPNALEVTEPPLIDQFNGGICGTLGEVRLVNAGLKGDRVHVTFVRVLGDGEGQQPPAENRLESRRVTYWEMETPASWAKKWEGAEAVNVTSVAGELLAELGKGEVELKTMISREAFSGDLTRHMIGKPTVFFGGNYVNTALSLKGVFFNTRMIGSERIGVTGGVGYAAPGEDWWKGHSLSLNSTARDEVEWRHWGLWVDEIKGTNAASCGLPQPAFPIHQLNVQQSLVPGVPTVMAMARVSQTGSKTMGAGRVRWCVGLISGEPEVRIDRKVDGADFGKDDPPVMLQALVLKGAKENESEDGREWMESLAAGKCEVLDAVTLTATEDSEGSCATGVEYYFTNGRETGQPETKEPVLAKVEMEPGTEFASQVYLQNRLVGLQFSFGRGRWKLERDAREPKVITDVFKGVSTEFPIDHQTMKWKDMPKVTVNVQRPIFEVQKAEGFMPKKGEMVVQRLSDSEVVLVRSVAVRKN